MSLKLQNFPHLFFNLTLILNARLNPEAKNPPNGPMTELNTLNDKECNKYGYIVMTVSVFP